MRSSIEGNGFFRGLTIVSDRVNKYLFLSTFFIFAIIVVLIPAGEVIGCSGVPSPEMVIFLTEGSGANITYPEPSTGASAAAGERIYVIDEDTSKTFHVLWNTNGNATIQLSDSVSYVVDTVDIGSQCSWWDGGPLVPLAAMQNFLQGTGSIGLSMIEDDDPDLGNQYQKMEFISEAPGYNSLDEYLPNALNPMKQAVFAIVPDNNSNNPQWRSAGNEARGYHSSVGQYPRMPVGDQSPLEAVYTDPDTGELNPATPLVEFQTLMLAGPDGQKENADDNYRVLRHTLDSYGAIDEEQILPFCDPEDPYTVASETDNENFCCFAPDNSVIPLSRLWGGPGSSKTTGVDATQRMVVLGSKYRSSLDPKWDFMGMGIVMDIDPTNIIASSNEQAITDMQSGEISCKFTVPTEPFFLETEISVVFLFYLKDAILEWYEVIQTWNGTSWEPASLPIVGGDLTKVNTGALNGGSYSSCVLGPYSSSVKGYMLRPAENPENQAKTLIAVRDTTPPAFTAIRTDSTPGANKFTMTPPALTGSTGDTLAQNLSNPRYVEVTVFDNNPYAPFLLMNDGTLPDLRPDLPPGDDNALTFGEGNINLELYYNTEVYDYCKVEKTDSDLPDDTNMSSNLFNRRMVWAKTAFGTAGVRDQMNAINTDDIGNMEYEIYDEQCNPISTQILARMNAGGDAQKISAGSEQAAFSTITFKVPIESFMEPMPLHACNGSKALGNKKLKWFPLISDASGNLAPYGGDSYSNFGDELHNLTVQDPTADTIRGDNMPSYSAPDEDNILGVNDVVMVSAQKADGTELITSSYVESNWYKLFDGDTPSDTTDKFGEMGTIDIEDDEPPQIFIYVTDTKYNKTYRFGLQKEGDSARTSMMKKSYDAATFDGWCDEVQPGGSSYSLDTGDRINYGLRNYDLATALVDTPERVANSYFSAMSATNDFEPKNEIVFDDKIWNDYNEYIDSAVENDTFNPSAGYPSSLPGCWVDEDTRLLFHVVAYDNCSTYDRGGSSSSSDEMSIFDKKEGGTGSYGNGIVSLDWKIKDNGQEFTDEYMNDYVFRNPSVDDNFNLTGNECSIEVTAEDNSGNSRTMRILFFVMSNKMKFRSIEEKSGRGTRSSWF